MEPSSASIHRRDAESCWLAVNRYYSNRHQYYAMELHTHREAEIMYVMDGRCKIDLGDSVQQLREGHYIFLDSMVPHRLSIERGAPCRLLNIEAGLEKAAGDLRLALLGKTPAFAKFRQDAPAVVICQDHEGILRNGIVCLQRLLQQEAHRTEIDLQLALVLLEVARQYAEGKKKRLLGTTVHVKRAMNYIAENFDDDIKVSDIAAAAGVSRSHLQRAFRQAMGCTIVEKINELRLEKAKYLLDTSTLPIADVAGGVGYGSRQYFTDLFLKRVGCTPARYRRDRGSGNLSRGHGGDPSF